MYDLYTQQFKSIHSQESKGGMDKQGFGARQFFFFFF